MNIVDIVYLMLKFVDSLAGKLNAITCCAIAVVFLSLHPPVMAQTDVRSMELRNRIDTLAEERLQLIGGETSDYGEASKISAEIVELVKQENANNWRGLILALHQYVDDLRQVRAYEKMVKPLEEILKIQLQVSGKDYETVLAIDALAQVFFLTKRFDQAEPLFGTIVLYFDSNPPDAMETRMNAVRNHALALFEVEKFKEAEPLFGEIVSYYTSRPPENLAKQMEAVNDHAHTLFRLKRDAEALPLYRRVYEFRKKRLGEDDDTTLKAGSLLLSTMSFDQDTQKAEGFGAELLERHREKYSWTDSRTVRVASTYARVVNDIGKFKKARELWNIVHNARSSLLGEYDLLTLSARYERATSAYRSGDFTFAESEFLENLELYREHVGKDHPDTLLAENAYAAILAEQGRGGEALPIFERLAKTMPKIWGVKKVRTLVIQYNLASNLQRLGYSKRALPIARKAFFLLEEVSGPNNHHTLNALGIWISSLRSIGNLEKAETLVEKLIKQQSRAGDSNSYYTQYAYFIKAEILSDMGRFEEADHVFQKIVFDRDSTLGANHPNTNRAKVSLASNRLRTVGKEHLAIQPIREVIENRKRVSSTVGFAPNQQAQLDRDARRRTYQFELLANAAWVAKKYGENRDSDGSPKEQPDLDQTALSALQKAGDNNASRAVVKTAARRAAANIDPKLGPKVKERQALSDEWLANDIDLIKIAASQDEAIRSRLPTLQMKRNDLENRIFAIDDVLREQAPSYFALIRPEPLAVNDLNAMFAEDEAAIILVPTQHGTHVMAISDGKINWHRSDWDTARIEQAVSKLLWFSGASYEVDVELAEKWNEEEENQGPRYYDFVTAHALYKELLSPIIDHLTDKKHLFVSAAGSLSRLPLSILVSEKPNGKYGDPRVLRSAKWFAEDFAIVQIPSLQSLQFLRKFGSASADRNPDSFLGFGDPVLEGEAEQRGVPGAQRSKAQSEDLFVGVFKGSRTRRGDAIADISELKKMARLPGTRTELEAMWNAFGRPENGLYLAEEATETAVQQANLNVEVLTFATHGLLAQDIDSSTEPGLVLTPPNVATGSNDGYLSASEIAGLKMDVDWVILSACNTAGADGSSGSSGLSGLARSFFYAGAQNLLATYWPVRDDVAAKLTVRTIEIAKKNSELSRAQAFQRAMREIRENPVNDSDANTFAHPGAWAPFALIGDR